MKEPQGQPVHPARFTDDKTEAQKGREIHPKSCDKWVAKPRPSFKLHTADYVKGFQKETGQNLPLKIPGSGLHGLCEAHCGDS